jgi:hypothetical protein
MLNYVVCMDGLDNGDENRDKHNSSMEVSVERIPSASKVNLCRSVAMCKRNHDISGGGETNLLLSKTCLLLSTIQSRSLQIRNGFTYEFTERGDDLKSNFRDQYTIVIKKKSISRLQIDPLISTIFINFAI